jgi:metal-responsive CopG/Arc/MetJ family transcriptional regulator
VAVKTAVSIPDDVFRRVERLAKQRKVSRSQLYTAALIRLLEAEHKDELTRAHDAAFTDHRPDRFTDDAERSALAGVQWSIWYARRGSDAPL